LHFFSSDCGAIAFPFIRLGRWGFVAVCSVYSRGRVRLNVDYRDLTSEAYLES